MKIIRYSRARETLRSVLDEVVITGIPVCIISKRSQAVVLSKEEYDRLAKVSRNDK